MPELPEVETTMRGIAPSLIGQPIAQVEVMRRDLRWPIPDELEEVLVGSQFCGFERIGKYLIMHVQGGQSLIAHLGMSGTFRIAPSMPQTLRKHDHVLIELENGAVLIFRDPRRFGFVLLQETAHLREHPRLAEMGPDPFDTQAFTGAYLQKCLAKRHSPIKPILLDQHLVAGIGNIYASEALFRAKISPQRAASSLTFAQCNRLVLAIREVLGEAIESGGSTLRDFTGGDGSEGYFQHHFAVYDREHLPCVACGKAVDKSVMAGRATYFCASCQC